MCSGQAFSLETKMSLCHTGVPGKIFGPSFLLAQTVGNSSTAQIAGFLTTGIEFPAPGFSLTQPCPLWIFGETISRKEHSQIIKNNF